MTMDIDYPVPLNHMIYKAIRAYILSFRCMLQYPADGNDKTWLYDNKHLPVHGGKVWFSGSIVYVVICLCLIGIFNVFG